MKLKDLVLSVTNVNLRREMAGKETGPIAVDVSLQGLGTPYAELEGLFSTKASYDRLLAGLFDKDDELRTSDLKRQELSIEAKGLIVMLSVLDEDGEIADGLEEVRIKPATLNKLSFQPCAGGKVNWSCRLQFLMENVSPALEDVAELMRNEVLVDVSSSQRDLPLEQAEEKGAAPGKKETASKGMPAEIH